MLLIETTNRRTGAKRWFDANGKRMSRRTAFAAMSSPYCVIEHRWS